MKKNMKSIWLTAMLLAGTYSVNAQELPPPPPPLAAARPEQPGQAPKPEARPGKGIIKNPELIKLSTIKGTVINPIANDRFEYNGLLVKTNTGNVNVMFPPHLGEQILAKAKNGAAVTITGNEDTNPEGKKEFRMVGLEANGTRITDAPPVAPIAPVAPDQKTITATVKALNYNVEKTVNGFTLSSGERVSIPPHVAFQLNTLLKPNEKVVVTGFLEPKRPGVVYSQNTTLLNAQTLGINGQTYLVR